MQNRKLKILYVVSEDWYFVSHRLGLALAVKEAGYDVVVATRVTRHNKLLSESGLKTVALKTMRRSSINPFRELITIVELIKVFWKEQPDLVHQVAIKPVVYGTIAAKLVGVSAVVNALGGLGFIFSSKSYLANILRPILVNLFRYLLNDPKSRLIVQNHDDLAIMTNRKIAKSKYIQLIRSAGVDMDLYKAEPCDEGIPIIMLASRMLWDKGIGEFVKAARYIREDGLFARFVLVGEPDEENPTSISIQQLQNWHKDGVVEWWGYRTNMQDVLPQARIICLPTYYGEGIPKVLIEAMASSRPIITTDMPGCRELVQEGKNGILIPPRNISELVSAIKKLLHDPEACKKMGREGRSIAVEQYALQKVIGETLSVYGELLYP